jgi:hypothetical protein
MNFYLRGEPSGRISPAMFVSLAKYTKYLTNQWSDFAKMCGNMRAGRLAWTARR